MAKRWLHSADVQIDDETGALLVKLACGFRAISAPAAVTATAGQWTAIDLPEGAAYVHVGVSEETYLVAKVASGDPSDVGCGYKAAGNHQIDCAGCTKLYARPAGASDSAVTWTPFDLVSD